MSSMPAALLFLSAAIPKNYILLLAMIILSGGMLVGPDQVLFVVI